MKIDEVIIQLEKNKNKHGNNIDVCLELHEDVPCEHCGEEKYHLYTGNCETIGCASNASGTMFVWFAGEKD